MDGVRGITPEEESSPGDHWVALRPLALPRYQPRFEYKHDVPQQGSVNTAGVGNQALFT